jgi:hypothetical protein
VVRVCGKGLRQGFAVRVCGKGLRYGGRLELRVSMGEFGDVDKCWHQDMGESTVSMGEMR